MTDGDTLLAYLVSSFPGNTENIATEALGHIFRHSDASVVALNDVVQSGVRGVSPIINLSTQVVQPDGTRPDLVGFDEDGKQRVLIEVKFWAELTPSQPNSYLKCLPDDGPAVVGFLAPEDRIASLWAQLMGRMRGEFGTLTETDAERRCVRVGDDQRHLMTVSWGGLLDSMAARSGDDGQTTVVNEIRQLRTLARYADQGALKPIGQDEGFDAESQDRQRLMRRLIDAATERGIQEEWVSRRGLRATPRSYGYGRYIRLHSRIVWFGVNLDLFGFHGRRPCGLIAAPICRENQRMFAVRCRYITSPGLL